MGIDLLGGSDDIGGDDDDNGSRGDNTNNSHIDGDNEVGDGAESVDFPRNEGGGDLLLWSFLHLR